MRISVIIPVYNAADYLDRCLDSLMGEDAEVIVVDDGSTDSTSEILQEYSRRHGPIKIISQNHKGVSAARNAGLAACHGDWIVFVDADDYIENGALYRLPSVLEANLADIVIMRSFCDGEERYPWMRIFAEGRGYGAKDLITLAYMRGSVCGCAFSKRFLQENALLFPEHISHSEDLLFMSMALSEGACVSFSDIVFYQICSGNGSASRKIDNLFYSRYSQALISAGQLITDDAVRIETSLRIVLGMTNIAIKEGLSPRQAISRYSLDRILPLRGKPLSCKSSMRLRLLNFSYTLFYYSKLIAEKCKG